MIPKVTLSVAAAASPAVKRAFFRNIFSVYNLKGVEEAKFFSLKLALRQLIRSERDSRSFNQKRGGKRRRAAVLTCAILLLGARRKQARVENMLIILLF